MSKPQYTQEQLDIQLMQQEMQDIRESVDGMRDDIKDLTAALNRGKGMFAGAMIVAGGVGAIFVKVLAYLTR